MGIINTSLYLGNLGYMSIYFGTFTLNFNEAIVLSILASFSSKYADLTLFFKFKLLLVCERRKL